MLNKNSLAISLNIPDNMLTGVNLLTYPWWDSVFDKKCEVNQKAL